MKLVYFLVAFTLPLLSAGALAAELDDVTLEVIDARASSVDDVMRNIEIPEYDRQAGREAESHNHTTADRGRHGSEDHRDDHWEGAEDSHAEHRHRAEETHDEARDAIEEAHDEADDNHEDAQEDVHDDAQEDTTDGIEDAERPESDEEPELPETPEAPEN
jgi:hypothetical protein